MNRNTLSQDNNDLATDLDKDRTAYDDDAGLPDIAEQDQSSSESVGLDMVKIGYQYNLKELKVTPWNYNAKQKLEQAGIKMTHKFYKSGSYLYFKFNANAILGSLNPYPKSTEYYAKVFSFVERTIRNILHDGFSLDDCIVSNLEIHRTFHVKQKPYDYYKILKELHLQFGRKTSYRTNSENSGSIYWLTNGETFVIYDKTDRIAYKHKKQRKILENMADRIIRAEWRLKTHELIQSKLGVVKPADLLRYYNDVEKQYTAMWSQILFELTEQPFKRTSESVSEIEAEFRGLKSRNNQNYANDAILNRYIGMLCQSGEIDNFFVAKKGSPECNRRLNKKAQQIKLSTSRPQIPHMAGFYNELRDKILSKRAVN